MQLTEKTISNKQSAEYSSAVDAYVHWRYSIPTIQEANTEFSTESETRLR